MKKSIIIALLLILSTTVFSQRFVVGILERVRTNDIRWDYYYSLAKGNGSENALKQSMEKGLKQNPQFNYMTDFAYTYVSLEGQTKVVIIVTPERKYGVGFGMDRDEALQNALDFVKGYLHINKISDYQIITEKDITAE